MVDLHTLCMGCMGNNEGRDVCPHCGYEEAMRPQPVSYDAMLAAYLLNPNASDYSLKRLQEEAGTAAPKLENETAWQAAVLPRVKNWQAASLLANGQRKLLEEMEIPLAQVLARMENIGFLVDGESIRVYGERLETEIEALQKQIYEEVGYEFNINSPKQLGDALFVKLGLPSGKKTKTADGP